MINKIYSILGIQFQNKFFYILFLMIIGMALETLSIAMIIPALVFLVDKNATETFISSNEELFFLSQYSQNELIISSLILILIIYFLKAIYMFFLAWKQNSFAFSLLEYVSRKIFKKYVYQSYPFHLRKNSSELIRNITFEVNQFTIGTVLSGLTLLSELFILIGISALLLYVQPYQTIIVIILITTISAIYYSIIKSYILDWGKRRQFHERFRLQHIQQSLFGIKDLKVLGKENFFIDQFSFHNFKNSLVGRNQGAFQQMPRIGIEFIGVICIVVVFAFMLNKDDNLSAAITTIGLFAAAAFRVMPSINRIISSLQSIRFASPSINVIHSELALLDHDITEYKNLSSSQKLELSKISLKNISFSHEGESKLILKNLSINISKGEMVGIIGPSGSGKSTLVDIFLGLLKANSGEILMNNINVFNDKNRWQNSIGYVPQDIYLTDNTIKRNIAFGVDDAEISEELLRKAIKSAKLEDFINTLKNKENSDVGELGNKISGGQKQRIGIARALYNQPNILIFDEATSALDEHTEQDIMNSVKDLKGKITILIITHRLNTLKYCDSVYEIDGGRVLKK